MSGSQRSVEARKIQNGSLQRTKAALIYNATGDFRAFQIVLGRTKSRKTLLSNPANLRGDYHMACVSF